MTFLHRQLVGKSFLALKLAGKFWKTQKIILFPFLFMGS